MENGENEEYKQSAEGRRFTAPFLGPVLLTRFDFNPVDK